MDGLDNDNTFNFDIPALVNQPPKVFGAYGSDGSPIPAAISGSMFDDNGLGLDESADAKRRRIARVYTFPIVSFSDRGSDVWLV